MNSPSKNTEWLLGGVLLFLAILMFGFFGYLYFFVLPSLAQKVQAEKRALESAKAETLKLLTPELRSFFEMYSDGISGFQALNDAREKVFTGNLDPDRYEPFMILPFPEFIVEFQNLLGKKTLLSNLTIDPIGRVSFLITTTSYFQAAEQIAALQTGFSDPPLLISFEVSSVGRKMVTGKAEDLPEFLRQENALTQFLIEAKVNPEYYFAMRERKKEK